MEFSKEVSDTIIPVHLRDRYRERWHYARATIKAGFDSLELVVLRLIHRVCRPPAPKNPDQSINLHLGCGEIDYPGFINIDARPYKHVHFVQRVDRLSRFSSNTCDLIYVSHCLEHFPFWRIEEILGEWRRVLKPGGILRISVPNFDSLLEIYLASGRDVHSIEHGLLGAQTYRLNYHCAIFSAKSLEAQLRRSGFVAVRPWRHSDQSFLDVCDASMTVGVQNGLEVEISLNLEAIK